MINFKKEGLIPFQKHFPELGSYCANMHISLMTRTKKYLLGVGNFENYGIEKY